MLYAIVKDNALVKAGILIEMFPDCGFPVNGPNQEWMNKNNVVKVIDDISYNPATHRLESTTPYIEGGVVYSVKAIARDPVDIANERNNAIYAAIQSSDNSFLETLSAAEKEQFTAGQAIKVRTDRDRLLAKTDWRFRSDMNPSQAWIDYCQALRDIPQQAGFPWNVQWPTKPE